MRTETPRRSHRDRVARQATREHCEQGSASVWALLITATAFTLLLGLVVDGGSVIDARLESSRAAAQAARLGADALSESSLRSGRDQVDPAAATSQANSYLQAVGLHGSTRVSGHTVTVTVRGRTPTQILAVVGIGSFPILETRTARAVTERGTP